MIDTLPWTCGRCIQVSERRVKIPPAEVREGCALLIERIRGHCGDAQVLVNAGRSQGAFLLILLAFEEVGKLLELIQAAAVAERSSVPYAEVTTAGISSNNG